MEMIDLAREAFRCANFDLAVGIYDKLLEQHGQNMEWLIGKASSLAKQNRFNEAVNSIHYACRLGSLPPSTLLKILVEPIVDYITRNTGKAVKTYKQKSFGPYSCGICLGILFEPFTLPCGHSFCKDCLKEIHRLRTCQICHTHHPLLQLTQLSINVIINKSFEKYFPLEMRARRLKQEGNRFFKEREYDKALKRYCEALELDPNDHLSLSNRSHVFVSMERYEEALKDAEMVCQLRPNWAKGYYRKGTALKSLCQYDNALLAYLQCLTLDPTVTSAKEAIAEVMHTLLHSHQQVSLKHCGSDHHFYHAMSPSAMETDPCMPLNILTASNLSELITMLIQLLKQKVEMESQSATAAAAASPGQPDASCQEEEKMQCSDMVAPGNEGTDADANMIDKAMNFMDLNDRKHETPIMESPGSSQPRQVSCSLWCSQAGRIKHREIREDLVVVEDYECSLCYRLFYHPLTTPCGHTFCRGCLYRSLDYSLVCPLCKGCLSEFISKRYEAETIVISDIVRKYLPRDFQLRQTQQHEEWNRLFNNVQGTEAEEIPIFVCIQAFPTIPCPLHIFEPRYRLMIRQCMESGSRQFGMCIPGSGNSFSEYGVMLEIREVQHLPDGRSIVDTVGGRRFKVLERGMKDGYNTAKVTVIQDTRVEGEAFERVQQLNDSVYQMAARWYNDLIIPLRVRIEQHFGAMPEREVDIQENPNGPRWLWWLVAILPIDASVQQQIVSKVSLQERLLMLQRILNRMNPS